MSNETAVTCLSTVQDLEALGPVWRDLQDACSYQHVLMDHRWLMAWWRHFGTRARQHTLLITRGRTPAGIVPLALTWAWEQFPLREPYLTTPDDYRHLPYLRRRRFVPLRRLAFPLGLIAGNMRGQAIFPDHGRDLFQASARYVASISRAWDVAVLAGLRPSAGEDRDLAEAARLAGLGVGSRRTVRPMLHADLPDSFDEFMRARSANFRRRLEKECNQLERDFSMLGPMSVRAFRGADIDEGLRVLFLLEGLSWKVHNDKGRRMHLRLDDEARAFFAEAASRFAADDQAQVLVLQFGDTPAAAMFTLERGGAAVCVLTYRNEHLGSPVAIAPIWRELVRRSIDQGLRKLDINGYNVNYLKWTKDSENYVQPILYSSRPYSRLLHAMDEGALAMRDWLSRLRHGLSGSRGPVQGAAAEPSARLAPEPPVDHRRIEP